MKITRDEAFRAGWDAAKNGGNDTNSHFTFFSNDKVKGWWQEGYDSMLKLKTMSVSELREKRERVFKKD